MFAQFVPLIRGEALDDTLADARMLLHPFKFVRLQLPFFEQQCVGNPDLANVMQLCCLTDVIDVDFAETESLGDTSTLLDPAVVDEIIAGAL